MTIHKLILNKIEFNRNGIIPIYYQLQEALWESIEDGIYKPHDKLPSENEICAQLHVSRNTAQRALKAIVDKGAAYRVQGRGTFVTDKSITFSVTAKLSFSSEIIGLTKKIQTILNFSKNQSASPHIARLLEIEEGEQVTTIQRIRQVDGTSTALMTSYIPQKLVPGLIDTLVPEASLYKTVKDRYGLEVLSATETLKTVNANEYEAHLLNIAERDAVFLIERISKSTAGHVLELARTVLRGDISKFYLELGE
ncbi:MAG: GntR family transcriptional regulator [Candidatus Marinimicrobia bacterium]|nr:GntR family transcriptional regulator [Candidatus Neomarinimicrobiota bacterium]